MSVCLFEFMRNPRNNKWELVRQTYFHNVVAVKHEDGRFVLQFGGNLRRVLSNGPRDSIICKL